VEQAICVLEEQQKGGAKITSHFRVYDVCETMMSLTVSCVSVCSRAKPDAASKIAAENSLQNSPAGYGCFGRCFSLTAS
jgi:hypothetical protein